MNDDDVQAMLYDWTFWARDKQIPPNWAWQIWLILTGRGWGKTRTGAEWVRDQIENKGRRRIALVGRTTSDVRDVMVEGESGILAICPPWNRPQYQPTKRRIVWPNGAIATTYSGDRPDQLRGPQHDGAWADELAAWRYPDSWDQLLFGLRLGIDPQVVVTTTPRPTKLIKRLIKDKRVAVTKGHTLENKANLAPSALRAMLDRYGGTRLGRQELAAEILDDNPDALWKREDIEKARVRSHPDLDRVIVAVDPAATSKESSNETGIVVAGIATLGDTVHGYVLDDATLKGRPDVWANAAITAYNVHHGSRIVGEVNNGGEMVEHTLRTVDASIPYKAIHASRGKRTRAEPIAALYEQGRIHHVGMFAELEDQLCQWVPGNDSPDRLDALVWALSELIGSSIDFDSVPQDPGRPSPWDIDAKREADPFAGSKWVI